MEFAISWPKMVQLPQNKKQTYRLNFMPQLWPSDLSFAMNLTTNYHGQIWNLLNLSQRWFDCQNWKVCVLNELKASMTIKFHVGHDLEMWGVRICRIVTRVTSGVGVPSTRLVDVKQATWLASKDSYATNETYYFGTIMKIALYHTYHPLFNILHE